MQSIKQSVLGLNQSANKGIKSVSIAGNIAKTTQSHPLPQTNLSTVLTALPISQREAITSYLSQLSELQKQQIKQEFYQATQVTCGDLTVDQLGQWLYEAVVSLHHH